MSKKFTTAEARREVRGQAFSDDAVNYVERLLSNVDLEADILKVAEFILLTQPVTEAVATYLAKDPFSERPVEDITELVRGVGVYIGEKTVQKLAGDPERQALVDKIALLRSQSEGMEPENFYPPHTAIMLAAVSSVDSMYNLAQAVYATAKIAGADQGRTHPDFVDMLKRSTRPALLRPMVPGTWNSPLIDSFDIHTLWLFSGQKDKRLAYNEGILEYDPKKDEVDIKKALSEMVNIRHFLQLQRGAPPHNYTMDKIDSPDVPIGCPITFDPEVQKGYFANIVGLLDKNSLWLDISLPRDPMEMAIVVNRILASVISGPTRPLS